MEIDTTAAGIEAAAKEHAAGVMRAKGNLWTRERIRRELETAVIRGYALAKRDSVQATDELLAAARAPRGAL
jgi:hypothetical protein